MNMEKSLVNICRILFALFLFVLSSCATQIRHEAEWEMLNVQVADAYHKGRYAEGIQLAEKAMQYTLAHFGKEHPSTLISINSLAGLYESQGRYGEAEPLYQEALQLSEKVLGPNHPNTLTIQTNGIALMVAMNRRLAAFRLMRQMEDRLFSRSFQELYTTSEDRVRRRYLMEISKFQDVVFSFALQHPQPAHTRFAAEVVLRWKQVYAEEYAFTQRFLCVSDDLAVKRLQGRMAQLRSAFGHAVHHQDSDQRMGQIILSLTRAEAELREKAKRIKPELTVTGADLNRVPNRFLRHSAGSGMGSLVRQSHPRAFPMTP